jgi:hypothetical protein
MEEDTEKLPRSRFSTVTNSWGEMSFTELGLGSSSGTLPDPNSHSATGNTAANSLSDQSQNSASDENGSLIRNEQVDTDDGLAERLCQSLNLTNLYVAVNPAPHSPQFDSLDSTHLGALDDPDGDFVRPSMTETLRPPHLLGRSLSQTDQTSSIMTDSWIRPDYYPSSDEEKPPEEPEPDQSERLKVKLLSAWNNMKHGQH